jgi:hypothetical protein
MTLYGTLALLSWLGFFASLIYSFIVHFNIIDAINRKHPPGEDLDLWTSWMGRGAVWRLGSLYRMYYPSGKLIRRYWLVEGAAILFFITSIVMLFHALR